jgi:Phage protein Gp138 N-terminal domain
MPRDQITDAEIADAQEFGTKAGIYKVMPGIVVAYHASAAGKSPPSVDVQPGVHDLRIDTETGERVSEPWPIIASVPLAWPKGGGASIAFAMAKGDKVLLLSFDQDPTAHRGTGNAEDPPDAHRHGGGHWIALPFDITDAGAVADPGGDIVITPAATVVIGPGASDFAALASKTNAAIKAWGTWAASGTGTGYTRPTPATKPADPDVGCTLLKTK